MSATPDFHNALVFTGGGTGGHYYPAVALAEGARERWPDRPIAFVGAQRGIEARKLPESAWPHLLLDVEGLMGRHPLGLMKSVLKLWKARRHLIGLWKRQRPAAVLGTGGYGSAPAILAARALGIPYFLHESNAAPGALVKHLARGAAKVWVGMPEAAAALPGAPCRTVGTPVREAFLRDFWPVAEMPGPWRLLVLGGSGGARPLNEALLDIAPALLDRFEDWEILHQAGLSEAERLKDRPRHPRHHLVPFLEDMDRVMESASVVISRSGASTCAELAATGRPALLVPFPQSAGDHQTANARAMEAAGRGRCLLQGPDLASRLEEAAAQWMGDQDLRAGCARPERNTALSACLDDLGAVL